MIDTKINATEKAAAIVVFRNDARLTMTSIYLKNVDLLAPETLITPVHTGGTNEISLSSTNIEGTLGTSLSTPDEDYVFYYQTREGANGTKDYRVICVAKTEWIIERTSIDVEIEFDNGANTVSSVQKATVVYNSVTATADGYTDVYYAAKGSVVFGWVITGVPTDYNVPTAVVVD